MKRLKLLKKCCKKTLTGSLFWKFRREKMFFRNSEIQGQRSTLNTLPAVLFMLINQYFNSILQINSVASLLGSPTSGHLWHTPTKKEKERRRETKKKRNTLPDSKDNNLTVFFQLSSLWPQRQKRASRAWCTAISRPLTECLMSAQRVKRTKP